MRAISLAIVGIPYPNKRGPTRRFELELCVSGEPVELRPEPNNKFDEHAVSVFSCRGVQLGYLASERAVFIGKLIREGREILAIFQGMTPTCAWVRVGFDGVAPTLPVARGSGQPGPGVDGFWPDETYDDE